jgi:hypothetical protein
LVDGAPTELADFLAGRSTKMPRRWRWREAEDRRSRGPGGQRRTPGQGRAAAPRRPRPRSSGRNNSRAHRVNHILRCAAARRRGHRSAMSLPGKRHAQPSAEGWNPVGIRLARSVLECASPLALCKVQASSDALESGGGPPQSRTWRRTPRANLGLRAGISLGFSNARPCVSAPLSPSLRTLLPALPKRTTIRSPRLAIGAERIMADHKQSLLENYETSFRS